MKKGLHGKKGMVKRASPTKKSTSERDRKKKIANGPTLPGFGEGDEEG